ncbi:MAG: UDP-N-acetylmuramate--L-alanine ligase [Bacillota bacterium]|jgi:UDP-N-acetylmuramate--alanine ligase
MQTVHFIAIGGQSMSGIAAMLLKRGYKVTGSDLRESDLTRRLESMGAEIHIGHRQENLGTPDVVVVSSAIGPDNPELRLAREKGIPVVHRMDMLLSILSGLNLLAVAGSHGKTTTTSMLAWILQQTGLDPTFMLGGELIGQGTSHTGSGDYAVFETDESDGSFLKAKPDVAVVTNIDNDHLENWGSMQALEDAFFKFLESVKPGGLRVVCQDDPVLGKWAVGRPRAETYGFSPEALWRISEVRSEGWGQRASVQRGGEFLCVLRIQVPGRHNLQNALGALVAAVHCGLSPESVLKALETYPGVKRRLERVGEYAGVLLLDDFAHHPSEMSACLRTVREVMPKSRIIVVFQPHRYSRTRLLGRELGQALSRGDFVFVTGIYAGPGEKVEDGTSSMFVAQAVEDAGGRVRLAEDGDEAMRQAVGMSRAGDVIITMGAGDIWKTHKDAVQSILTRGE